jgi:hypothetical protein
MKKLIILTIPFLLLPFIAFSQQEFLSDARQLGAPIMANRYPDVKGSPYMEDAFVRGEIILKRGSTIKDVEIRYNAFEDIMEFKSGDDVLFMASDKISGFIMNSGGRPVLFKNGYSIPGFSANSFFIVIAEGENQLLKRVKKVSAPDPDAPYGSEGKAFSSNTSYHLIYNGASYPNIKLNKKSVLDIMPDRQKEVEDLVKSRKLDYRNENDVAVIINHLNGLKM